MTRNFTEKGDATGYLSVSNPSVDIAALVSRSNDSTTKGQKGKPTCEHCKKVGHIGRHARTYMANLLTRSLRRESLGLSNIS